MWKWSPYGASQINIENIVRKICKTEKIALEMLKNNQITEEFKTELENKISITVISLVMRKKEGV